MNFFKNFPIEKYDFSLDNSFVDIRNLFRYVTADIEILKNSLYITDYVIDNGERPDILSHKIYGNSSFWWTFFLINEHLIKDPSSYPLSQEGIRLYLEKNYRKYKVLQFEPKLELDENLQIKRYISNVNGKFNEGEIITGKTSGATAKIIKRNSEMQQLVISPIFSQFIENEFIVNELGEETEFRKVQEYIHSAHHYELDGLWVSPMETVFPFSFPYYLGEFGLKVDNDSPIQVVTNLEWEEKINDENSKIKIISPEHIKEFTSKYFELIR